jgi:hypothetical protein
MHPKTKIQTPSFRQSLVVSNNPKPQPSIENAVVASIDSPIVTSLDFKTQSSFESESGPENGTRLTGKTMSLPERASRNPRKYIGAISEGGREWLKASNTPMRDRGVNSQTRQGQYGPLDLIDQLGALALP